VPLGEKAVEEPEKNHKEEAARGILSQEETSCRHGVEVMGRQLEHDQKKNTKRREHRWNEGRS